MKVFDAVALQLLHLLDSDRRSNESSRVGIFIETVEAMGEPIRDASAATLRHAEHLRESSDRQDAGNDRRLNAGSCTLIAKPQKHVGIEEELRDRARRSGIDFRFQV